MTNKLTAVLLSIALFWVPNAFAQDEDESDGAVLEEVIVTAQRREESIFDVPISISAFSSDEIEKMNIRSATDYLLKTPNVGFSEDGEGGSRSINISIRGVSNVTLDGVATANSIGYYIDDLSVGSVAQGTINPQLQDMERIEVLRGPQGTYFGRNAIGGAVNITTKKPNAENYFEASINGGSFGTYGAEAIGNIAVSEKFMIRGVFAYSESDTAIKNVNPIGGDLSYEYKSGRISFRGLPSDNVTLDLSVMYTSEDEGGDISIPSGIVDLDTQAIFGLGATDAIDPGTGFYPSNDNRIDRDTIELNDKSYTIVNGRIAVDLDNMLFTSITGWVDSTFDRESDLDGTPFTFGPLPLRRVNDYEAESVSQEFRLMSTGDEGLSWIVGAYYANDDISRRNQIQIMKDDAPSGDAVAYINANVQNAEFRTLALFGEVTWSLTDTLGLTLAGRYSEDKVSGENFGTLFPDGDVQSGKTSEKFDNFSPRVVLRYLTDSYTVYGSVSSGFKTGGNNIGRNDAGEDTSVSFDSETLWAYEVGFKTQASDGRSNFSGAIFLNDWKDMQVQTNRLADPNDITSAVELTQNAPKASALGAELQYQTLVGEQLTWSVGVGYIDAEFDKFENAVLKGETNGLPNVIDVSGQPMIRTPKLTFLTSLEWNFDAGANADGFVRGEYTYTDNQYSDIEAIGSLVGETIFGQPFSLTEFPYQIDSYDLVNVYAGLNFKNFRVQAFVKNALDNQYYNGTADNFGASGIRLRPHFREWGLILTYMTN